MVEGLKQIPPLERFALFPSIAIQNNNPKEMRRIVRGDRLVVQNGDPDYGRFGRYVDRGRVYPPGFGLLVFWVGMALKK